MSLVGKQLRELLKFRKVALLLGRQKPEPLEEWDHVLNDRREVVHFVIPHTISSLPHRTAL